MPAPTPVPSDSIKVLQVIWFSFVASIGVYALVVLILRRSAHAFDTDVIGDWRPAFWAAGLLLAFVASRLRAGLQPVKPDAAVLRVRCITTWAASEAVAVIGLVLGFFTHSIEDFAPFALAALLLLYTYRPTTWPEATSTGGIT